MYLFLENRIKGQNVFSYSNLCGGLRNCWTYFSASTPRSIALFNPSLPVISLPSLSLGAKSIKTLSVFLTIRENPVLKLPVTVSIS